MSSKVRAAVVFHLQKVQDCQDIVQLVYPHYNNEQFARKRGGWTSAVLRQLHILSLAGVTSSTIIEGTRYYFKKKGKRATTGMLGAPLVLKQGVFIRKPIDQPKFLTPKTL